MGATSAPPEFIFFLPQRPVSGGPILFARLARHLASLGHRCQVVDYADGCLATATANTPGVELLVFEDDRPIEIGPEGLLVMQAVLPAKMRREMRVHPQTRLLFWVLHVMNLVQVMVPLAMTRDWQARSLAVQRFANRVVLRPFHRALRQFVKDLALGHSLVFMDGSTWRGTRDRLEVDVPPAFVPVMVDVPAVNPRRRFGRAGETWRAAWVGRLTDFKVGILNHTIASLDGAAQRGARDTELVVIGDGPLAHRVASSTRHVKVVRLGTVTGAALDAQLADADILFAMGTSALEGARLGVPAILLDFSYGRVPADYRYRWLHDAHEFDLGRLFDETTRGEDSAASLRARLDELDREPQALSQAAFDYCRDRHGLDVSAAAFLTAASQASFRFGAIGDGLRRAGIVRRAYERFAGPSR